MSADERAADLSGYNPGTVPAMRDKDRTIFWLMAAVILAVAAFAFTQSYSHIYDLARLHGESGTAARLLPLSVDGLIVAASLAIIHDGRSGDDKSVLTWGMLVLGIVATVAGNIGYGYGYGVIGMIISSWPAVAFLGAMGIAERKIRKVRTRPVLTAVPGEYSGPESVPGEAEAFADELARGKVPTYRHIRSVLACGPDRAKRVRRQLEALVEQSA